MALEGKHEFILYTRDGKKFVFNHKIDAMDALATGNLFEEVPRDERKDEPVEDAPKKRGRGRPRGIPMKRVDDPDETPAAMMGEGGEGEDLPGGVDLDSEEF